MASSLGWPHQADVINLSDKLPRCCVRATVGIMHIVFLYVPNKARRRSRAVEICCVLPQLKSGYPSQEAIVIAMIMLRSFAICEDGPELTFQVDDPKSYCRICRSTPFLGQYLHAKGYHQCLSSP
ncbi:uncharacterized protein ZBAI_02632 [Zygosaccharomyces bailii ISA1307]|nr:uncharacterized protein ZBAI_02632 [Zygosaccharomyces bailii ISA1307]